MIVSYAVAFSMTGFVATYLRFFPTIKKNYDYGVVIFLLTFNLITVSSFRQENILPLARDRLSTIAIGCAICLFMSLFVLPNWSGEDLHSKEKLQAVWMSIFEIKRSMIIFLISRSQELPFILGIEKY